MRLLLKQSCLRQKPPQHRADGSGAYLCPDFKRRSLLQFLRYSGSATPSKTIEREEERRKDVTVNLIQDLGLNIRAAASTQRGELYMIEVYADLLMIRKIWTQALAVFVSNSQI